MKYLEYERIDDYCYSVADKHFHSIGIGSDLNSEDIQDAFNFMRNYEKANRFDKAAMENAKDEALKVLVEFEKFWETKKNEALEAKKEKIRLSKELRENAPTIWENDILPKFKNLFKEIEAFTKIPGFEPYILNDQIKEELKKIEDVSKIVIPRQKVYIK